MYNLLYKNSAVMPTMKRRTFQFGSDAVRRVVRQKSDRRHRIPEQEELK